MGEQLLVHEARGRDIEASRGIHGDDDFGLQEAQLAGEDDFLLVAAAQRGNGGVQGAGADVEFFCELRGRLAHAPPAHDAVMREGRC